MKKQLLFALLPLFLSPLSSCSCSPTSPTYEGKPIFTKTTYEPLKIAHEDPSITITSTDLLGVYKGVKVAAWDDYDIKLRVNYSDGSLTDFPFKVINIPIEMRHLLGEVGNHSLELVEYKFKVKHDFTIIENPDWHGYKCEFFDKDRKYLHTETVGYYQNVTYKGPELPKEEEDYDYRYSYIGWDLSTEYIHQDMQYLAKYKKVEKRFFGVKPYNNDHIGLSALVDSSGERGSGLIYLGRVRRVAAFFTETIELEDKDIEFTFDFRNYGDYFDNLNEEIVKYAIAFEDDPDFSSRLYGDTYGVLSKPSFALDFDSSYDYKGIKAFLEDKSDVTLSSLNPYGGTFDLVMERISSYIGKGEVSKDDEPGFYRYAVTLSFDVYFSASFNRIESHVYEMGAFSHFIMAPVRDSQNCVVQYSEDGVFDNGFEEKLLLSTKGLYYAAEMIDWGK